MSEQDPVVIVGMGRTPMGGLLGDLASLTASELGAIAIEKAVSEAKLAPGEANEIIMGNCLPAGQGQAPARQAGFKSGQDKGLEATTINKMCGSGMQAAVMGRNAILAGDANIVIAGGMESMTNAPYLLPSTSIHLLPRTSFRSVLVYTSRIQRKLFCLCFHASFYFFPAKSILRSWYLNEGANK